MSSEATSSRPSTILAAASPRSADSEEISTNLLPCLPGAPRPQSPGMARSTSPIAWPGPGVTGFVRRPRSTRKAALQRTDLAASVAACHEAVECSAQRIAAQPAGRSPDVAGPSGDEMHIVDVDSLEKGCTRRRVSSMQGSGRWSSLACSCNVRVSTTVACRGFDHRLHGVAGTGACGRSAPGGLMGTQTMAERDIQLGRNGPPG